MGKKLKGGRRQILQLEEKKPPKVSSKSKVKSIIHYSDSDDDSKKSNESESPPSGIAQNKDATPLESQIADFFKEIDALSVPEELLEPDKATSSKAETVNENTPESCTSDTAVDLPAAACKDDTHSDVPNNEAYCPWQEICDSSTGYSYYWNVQTNEVTWDCPPEYTAIVQSGNTSTEKATCTAKNEKITDDKEKRKKKNDVIIPEGAIIPISYFGNSSSSDDSSDSESELASKKTKSGKVSELKNNKTVKMVESRSKSTEGEGSELIGPSLPPDFQFPETDTVKNETEEQTAVSQNEVEELVSVGSSLPPKSLYDATEKPSQSNLNEFPAESTTHESSFENSLKDGENNCVHLNENAGDESPDSTVKKGENSLNNNAYQVSKSTYGFRPVVEYDSFTDEDEEICVANISSSKPNTDEKTCEVKSPSQQEQENMTESTALTETLVEGENEISSFKRKASEPLKESVKKEELIKKPKRSDVNIDSLFASHSSYGKYGFGFGWQKQLEEQNDELCTTSTQDFKTHKYQSEFKAVSFVKSENILDLKALNDEMISEETNHVLPEESIQTNTECDQFNSLDQHEKNILNNELMENSPTKESIKISSDYDVGSSSILSIKDKIDCSILNKKKKNRKFNFNAGSTSLKVEDDLEEIDKALCEALDAKMSAKKLAPQSLPPVSDVSNASKNILEPTSPTVPVRNLKEAESVDENIIDTDAITDDILEISSELIDKLTFLLSAPSTHASFSGVFFQLQTRFVDWQAGALDSKYFMARLKELEQYIQQYETGVISGEWTYQWDRENKRYFFINTRTQHSQWTYPEELCDQDKSSWVQSQAEAGPSSSSSFTAERDDLQTVTSSSITMHENSVQKHSTSSFSLDSKDISSDTRWILQSSPPPPPPGVDSPPPPPRTPPPISPPPPPPDSTETLREPEDMDIENSNDSSSFLFVNNKSMTEDGRIQFLSMMEPSSKRSPLSFANSSIFNAVTSTSISGCDDLTSKISQSISHPHDSSEVNTVHWSQPSCSSQVQINSHSVGSASVSTDVSVNLIEEKNCDIPASSSSGVCSSQSDALQLKLIKPVNTVKREKKKTKIQPGLGLKKKNIPSLVEKWQKIKEQQDREDNNPDDNKSGNSF